MAQIEGEAGLGSFSLGLNARYMFHRSFSKSPAVCFDEESDPGFWGEFCI